MKRRKEDKSRSHHNPKKQGNDTSKVEKEGNSQGYAETRSETTDSREPGQKVASLKAEGSQQGGDLPNTDCIHRQPQPQAPQPRALISEEDDQKSAARNSGASVDSNENINTIMQQAAASLFGPPMGRSVPNNSSNNPMTHSEPSMSYSIDPDVLLRQLIQDLLSALSHQATPQQQIQSQQFPVHIAQQFGR